MGVETITLRHWMENERVAEETVQGPSMVWEMEETGWESKMDPVGRVAARLLENDCVPFGSQLGGRVVFDTVSDKDWKGWLIDTLLACASSPYLFVAVDIGRRPLCQSA